jgi:hypothetical protein
MNVHEDEIHFLEMPELIYFLVKTTGKKMEKTRKNLEENKINGLKNKKKYNLLRNSNSNKKTFNLKSFMKLF